MKTADLVARLAETGAPAPSGAPLRRLALALAVGAAVSFALLVLWLGLQPLHLAMRSPWFWRKALYTAALAVAGVSLADRLSRPARVAGRPVLIAGVVIALAVLLGGVELTRTPTADLARAWLGSSWRMCPWRILALSIPVSVGVLIGMRRSAPTRLGAAGAAAGFLAGSVAATVYGLYCEETSMAFMATWYTLGILASAAVGAVIGPRLLRW